MPRDWFDVRYRKAVYISPENAAVYARSAYTIDYRSGVEWCSYPDKRLQDTLLSCEVGSVRVKVLNEKMWTYEYWHSRQIPAQMSFRTYIAL